MAKIIMHCQNMENLIFMARAAKVCIQADMVEGDWKSLVYGEGQIPEPVYIGAIKRKSCISLYDQPQTPLESAPTQPLRPDPLTTWDCPIKHEGCVKNCGSYGCGN